MLKAVKGTLSGRVNWYTGKGIVLGIVTLVGALMFFLATSASAAPLRIVDDNDTVILRNNVHPLARPEFDSGATAPSLPMERMILSLKLDPGKGAELDRFLVELHDPASPNFKHWLTPEEFRERFAPSPEDIGSVTGWLTAHGFTVEEVARGGTWINFSGPVSHVERAFHTKIRDYYINGRLHHANAQDPSIPKGLADLVAGVVSLHDFPRKMMNTGAHPVQPDFTSGSTHYLSPGDFAIIYNVNALYSAGLDGSGQSIAIVGRTHPSSTNWATFRSTMGLSANPPQVIVNGTDPGDLGGGEDNEADLDVEWSGAVAKNATIEFVVSQSTTSTDGVDLSAQYIVNNNLAPVMSTSFGECESDLGHSERNFYKSLWQQAAAQGITSFVSTGDSGAAGCNLGSDSSGSGLAVNGLASTPYNVAVGGTQFNEGTEIYWNTSNTGYTSALNYIPETAWNESGNAGGSGLWSTGGGKSTYYRKPSWQVSPGVPADGKRDLPDVSLTAAGHDGYLVETQGALYAIGGTSASSPSFAGLMALIVQNTGQRQGNANSRFYQLAALQYGAGGATVFHDTTSGNNSVPGVTGYSCTTGYDLVTGLGSVDAYALVNNWVLTTDFAITAAPTSVSVVQGGLGTTTVSTSITGGFTGAISSMSVSPLPTGVTASFSPTSFAAPGGSSMLTFNAATTTAAGTYIVTIAGTSGSTTHFAMVNLTIIQAFTITDSVVNGVGGTITSSASTVPYGGSVTYTITPDTGYTLTGLTDNGVNVSAIEGPAGTFTYSISNVTANHTVIATFAVAAATTVSALPPFGLSAAILIATVLGYGRMSGKRKNN